MAKIYSALSDLAQGIQMNVGIPFYLKGQLLNPEETGFVSRGQVSEG